MTATNDCPTCHQPLETVEFAHDTKWAIWCPACNVTWLPQDQEPHADSHEPKLDKTQIVWPQQIKNTILRRKVEQAELDRIHRDAIRVTIRREVRR